MTAIEKTQVEMNHSLRQQDACIGIFETHFAAEKAIKELKLAGFNMKKLSILGQDYEIEEHVIGYYNTGDRMKFWGGQGAFWGSIWGLLFSSAFLIVPGIGHLIIAGPFVSILIGALEGAVVIGGLSALGAALYSIGVPKDSILRYESALKANKYLLLVHGTGEELLRARDILKTAGSTEVETHLAQHN